MRGVEVLVQWFPVAILEGDDWLTSRFSPLTRGTHWTERYVNDRAGLEIMEKRTTYFISQDSNHDSSGPQPAYYNIYFRHSRKWRNLEWINNHMRYISDVNDDDDDGVRFITMRNNINNYTETLIDEKAEDLSTLLKCFAGWGAKCRDNNYSKTPIIRIN